MKADKSYNLPSASCRTCTTKESWWCNSIRVQWTEKGRREKEAYCVNPGLDLKAQEPRVLIADV